MTFCNWMTQIPVWNLILNCSYNHMTVRKYSGLLTSGNWRGKLRQESLFYKAALGSFFITEQTGNTVQPRGEIKMSRWLLLLIIIKSFSNTNVEDGSTNFSLFLVTRKSGHGPQSRPTNLCFWFIAPVVSIQGLSSHLPVSPSIISAPTHTNTKPSITSSNTVMSLLLTHSSIHHEQYAQLSTVLKSPASPTCPHLPSLQRTLKLLQRANLKATCINTCHILPE